MRWRLYDPAPDSLRGLPAQRRDRIVAAVRRGEAVEHPEDVAIAIDTARWMHDQLETSYLDLLMAPLSLLAMLALVLIGWVQVGGLLGSLVNLVPFLAFMALIRIGGRVLFRHAPEALTRNESLREGQR